MAFKKAKDYNEERYGNFFMLRNDGDSADVIFLYQSYDDVLVADVHYLKSPDYSGYVHCNGHNCPACERGIRVQSKLFIPVYNIASGQIEFFDRSSRFENQLMTDVLLNYPNPSEYVFRITRHGNAGSMDTSYSIKVVGVNKVMSYSDIMSKFNTSLPEHYSVICKELTSTEMEKMFTTNNPSASIDSNDLPQYKITPRSETIQPTSDAIDDIENLSNDDTNLDGIEDLSEEDAPDFN